METNNDEEALLNMGKALLACYLYLYNKIEPLGSKDEEYSAVQKDLLNGYEHLYFFLKNIKDHENVNKIQSINDSHNYFKDKNYIQ